MNDGNNSLVLLYPNSQNIPTETKKKNKYSCWMVMMDFSRKTALLSLGLKKKNYSKYLGYKSILKNNFLWMFGFI